MALTREQVLAALEGVVSPQGIPLPTTGTLSEVVAGDGKVFFSITVDAADVKAWEPVRKRAEEIVRALPDDALIVAVPDTVPVCSIVRAVPPTVVA